MARPLKTFFMATFGQPTIPNRWLSDTSRRLRTRNNRRREFSSPRAQECVAEAQKPPAALGRRDQIDRGRWQGMCRHLPRSAPTGLTKCFIDGSSETTHHFIGDSWWGSFHSTTLQRKRISLPSIRQEAPKAALGLRPGSALVILVSAPFSILNNEIPNVGLRSR